MASETADIVICGAGIAGIAVAYHLSVKKGVRDIFLVDERQPLSLTSDKSTECYRNWWPGPDGAMVSLMNKSIDLMEAIAHESGNVFHLNRRGYLYATADPEQLLFFKLSAEKTSAMGAGPLRIHSGAKSDPEYRTHAPDDFEGQPSGADLILNQDLIRAHFPYLTERTIAVLHVRRAGWLSAQQLGMFMLNAARLHGLRMINAQVERVIIGNGRVKAVQMAGSSQRTIATQVFVNAAGPFLQPVSSTLGVDLPVYAELHSKVACKDHLNVIPRDAPLLIWSDPQHVPFSESERSIINSEESDSWLFDELPAGLHTRPEGGQNSQIILALWAYHTAPMKPDFPLPQDPYYAEIVIRGLGTMLPGMQAYLGKFPQPIIDGGYYIRTWDNRPIIGPTGINGVYIIGALSGFGVMAGCAAGELLSDFIVGNQLPSYAPAFTLDRFDNPQYQKLFDAWEDNSQL